MFSLYKLENYTYCASSSQSSMASSWMAVSWSNCYWLSMSSPVSLVACSFF